MSTDVQATNEVFDALVRSWLPGVASRGAVANGSATSLDVRPARLGLGASAAAAAQRQRQTRSSQFGEATDRKLKSGLGVSGPNSKQRRKRKRRALHHVGQEADTSSDEDAEEAKPTARQRRKLPVASEKVVDSSVAPVEEEVDEVDEDSRTALIKGGPKPHGSRHMGLSGSTVEQHPIKGRKKKKKNKNKNKKKGQQAPADVETDALQQSKESSGVVSPAATAAPTTTQKKDNSSQSNKGQPATASAPQTTMVAPKSAGVGAAGKEGGTRKAKMPWWKLEKSKRKKKRSKQKNIRKDNRPDHLKPKYRQVLPRPGDAQKQTDPTT